jgi:hypothetical protein
VVILIPFDVAHCAVLGGDPTHGMAAENSPSYVLNARHVLSTTFSRQTVDALFVFRVSVHVAFVVSF